MDCIPDLIDPSEKSEYGYYDSTGEKERGRMKKHRNDCVKKWSSSFSTEDYVIHCPQAVSS